MDWFLYDNGLRLQRVKCLFSFLLFFVVPQEVLINATFRGTTKKCENNLSEFLF